MNRVVNLVQNILKVIYKIKSCKARKANDVKKRNKIYNDEDILKEVLYYLIKI